MFWGSNKEDDFDSCDDYDSYGSYDTSDSKTDNCKSKSIFRIVPYGIRSFIGVILTVIILVSAIVSILRSFSVSEDSIPQLDSKSDYQEAVTKAPDSNTEMLDSALVDDTNSGVVSDYSTLAECLESGVSRNGFDVTDVRFRGVDDRVYYWSDLVSDVNVVNIDNFMNLTLASKKCFYVAQLTLALDSDEDLSSELSSFWYNNYNDQYMIFYKLLMTEQRDVIMSYFYALENNSVYDESFILPQETELIQERFRSGEYTSLRVGKIYVSVVSGRGTLEIRSANGDKVQVSIDSSEVSCVKELVLYDVKSNDILTVSGTLEVVFTYL